MFWGDRVPFHIPSCVCDDYVDNIFLSPFVCLSEREKERASISLVNDCVTWNGNESIKIVWQQWDKLFICKQRRMAAALHKAVCAYSPSGDRYCAWWNHCVFFSICASIQTRSVEFFATSVCATNFGPCSIAVSSTQLSADCARLKERQPPRFWNTNGKFKGFGFVWEAAMCQHAALSIKVAVCESVCVCDFFASLLFKALNPKSKLWENTLQHTVKVVCYSHAFSLDY